MRTDELLAASDENLWESYRILARVNPKGDIRKIDGILVTSIGVPMAFFNVAFVTRELDHADRALAGACRYFDGRDVRFVVRMREGVDPAVERAAPLAGLPPTDVMPGMILHPPHAGGEDPPDLEISSERDERTFRDHVAVCTAGFGMPEAVATDVIRHELLDEPAQELYVGYVDGRAVASSALVRTGRTAGVYNVATHPRYRRRGYGEAMTRHAVRRGVGHGCDIAVLQASPMGYPIYERMGFRMMAPYRSFVRPSEPATAAARSSSA